MQIRLVANFVRCMPWSAQWLCVPIAAALANAGHQVELVVDGLEPGVAESLGVPVRVLAPMRTHLGSSPGRFADSLRRLAAHGELISLTGRVPAPRWLPLDEPPGAMAARFCRELAPLSAALEFLHHPSLLPEAFAWARAARTAAAHGWRRQRLGDPATGALGSVARCRIIAEHRQQARERLGFDGSPTVLVSAADSAVSRLVPLSQALASLRAQAPRLLVLTPRAASVVRLASRYGVAGHVRVLGMTKQPSLAFAACDAVAVLPRVGHTSGGGGMIADALACGLPVAADPAASGAWMLGPEDLVRKGDWAGALAGVCHRTAPRPPTKNWLTIDDLAAKVLGDHLCSTTRA